LLTNKNFTEYWDEVGGENLSDDFKDLFVSMVDVDPSKRPTIQ